MEFTASNQLFFCKSYTRVFPVAAVINSRAVCVTAAGQYF